MDFPLLLPPPRSAYRLVLRRLLPAFFMGILVIGSLIQLFWPVSAFEKRLRTVQRWPQFPSSHFSLARSLVANGLDELARQETVLGKQQLDWLNIFFVGKLLENDWQKTQAVVYQKQILEEQLDRIDQSLVAYPYSWQLLTQKAVWHYQLSQVDSANLAWEKAWWLNPGDNTLETLGSMLKEQ